MDLSASKPIFLGLLGIELLVISSWLKGFGDNGDNNNMSFLNEALWMLLEED